MKENNTNDKMLIKVNKDSIFYKIKSFIKNLFYKKEETGIYEQENTEIALKQEEIKRNSFIESIQKVETEETKLLKLQQQYRNGEIQEKEMTQEQIKALCDLYDRQIEVLRKSNERRKQKLLEYRKKLQNA